MSIDVYCLPGFHQGEEKVVLQHGRFFFEPVSTEASTRRTFALDWRPIASKDSRRQDGRSASAGCQAGHVGHVEVMWWESEIQHVQGIPGRM